MSLLGVSHEAEQARLAELDLVDLSRVGCPRALRAGELLVLTDEMAGLGLLVSAGRLKVSRVSPEGKQLILWLLERGDLVMLPGDRRGKGSWLQVEAVEGSEFAVVQQRELEAFLRARPAVALAVVRQPSAQVRVVEERMEEIVFKDIGARLASALLRLAESYGRREASGGVAVGLRVTQHDLAHLIGASREMVSHSVAAWKQKGWVESQGRSIVLRRPEVLESLARGEPLNSAGCKGPAPGPGAAAGCVLTR